MINFILIGPVAVDVSSPPDDIEMSDDPIYRGEEEDDDVEHDIPTFKQQLAHMLATETVSQNTMTRMLRNLHATKVAIDYSSLPETGEALLAVSYCDMYCTNFLPCSFPCMTCAFMF